MTVQITGPFGNNNNNKIGRVASRSGMWNVTSFTVENMAFDLLFVSNNGLTSYYCEMALVPFLARLIE